MLGTGQHPEVSQGAVRDSLPLQRKEGQFSTVSLSTPEQPLWVRTAMQGWSLEGSCSNGRGTPPDSPGNLAQRGAQDTERLRPRSRA